MSAPLHAVAVQPLPFDRFSSLLTARQTEAMRDAASALREAAGDRTVWCVNSTARGGGVAQMLRTSVGYASGAGLRVRWVVVEGDERFFRVTKQLHNMLHGTAVAGDATLGAQEREIYSATMAANAPAIGDAVAPGDVVVLHDPQTIGLAPVVRAAGAHVVWRSHIGADAMTPSVAAAWAFLGPWLRAVERFVVTSPDFVWPGASPRDTYVVTPAIDPLASKNLPMSRSAAAGIARAIGLRGHGGGAPRFACADGSRGVVGPIARVTQERPLGLGERYVLHIARWDRLKDPAGVLSAFAEHVAPRSPAHLVLAGPKPGSVVDDPEADEVLVSLLGAWHTSPVAVRERVHILELEHDDLDVNGAVINALQRGASVVVKKSIAEGFGLGLTEAMWKSRPIVATGVGGVRRQVLDGITGVLVDDPHDRRAFGDAIVALLEDPSRAEWLGAAARARVRRLFLEPRHLAAWAEVLGDLMRPQIAARWSRPGRAHAATARHGTTDGRRIEST